MTDIKCDRDRAAMQFMNKNELINLAIGLHNELTQLAQRDLLTREGLCRFLQISPRSLAGLLARGALPRADIQHGRRHYWNRSRLIEWLTHQSSEARATE